MCVQSTAVKLIPSWVLYTLVTACGIWENVPFSKLLSFLQHFLKCNNLHLMPRTACILIPGYLLKPLQSLSSEMP